MSINRLVENRLFSYYHGRWDAYKGGMHTSLVTENSGVSSSTFRFVTLNSDSQRLVYERKLPRLDKTMVAKTHIETQLALNNGEYIDEWLKIFFSIEPFNDDISAVFA